MTKETVEKASLLEALENLKCAEHMGYDVGYNVGVEDCIRIIVDMNEPKFFITRLEYELLKYLDSKMYKYIARDKDGFLYVYKEKPSKNEDVWGTFYSHKMFGKVEDLFAFVEWSDKEPFSIKKLLCESEVLESD